MSDIVIIEVVKVIGIFGGIFLTAWLAYRFNKLKQHINSRMDELIKMVEQRARKEGAEQNQKETDAKPQKDK